MTSGLRYEESGGAWGDDTATYYPPDLRKLALRDTEVVEEPSRRFHYNNFNPLLVGLVLLVQNATDQFDTWAYAWSLVFLVGAGLRRWLTGAVRGHHDLATSGRGLISVGLVAFVGLAVFFELVVGIGGEGRSAGAAGRHAVAVVLILGGLALLGRRLLGNRQPRGARSRKMVAMSGSTTCPGCRLELPASGLPWERRRNASPECWHLYGEVQGFELAHRDLVRDYHQLAVDAYGAQHAPRGVDGDVPSISVAYSLVGLHLALDRGLPGLEVRAAHRRMGKPDASWPRLRAPVRRGAVTVWDVAAAGSMVGSVAGHANAVRGWAASVWRAWASQHGAVAELTDHLLR